VAGAVQRQKKVIHRRFEVSAATDLHGLFGGVSVGSGVARRPGGKCRAGSPSCSRDAHGRGLRCLSLFVSPVIHYGMAEVSIRELRNHGGEVIDRVVAGESLTVTRDGREVAELRPVGRRPLPAALLIARWSTLPDLDPADLRRDHDAIIDARL
jgi:prevent-host-death family protein